LEAHADSAGIFLEHALQNQEAEHNELWALAALETSQLASRVTTMSHTIQEAKQLLQERECQLEAVATFSGCRRSSISSQIVRLVFDGWRSLQRHKGLQHNIADILLRSKEEWRLAIRALLHWRRVAVSSRLISRMKRATCRLSYGLIEEASNEVVRSRAWLAWQRFRLRSSARKHLEIWALKRQVASLHEVAFLAWKCRIFEENSLQSQEEIQRGTLGCQHCASCHQRQGQLSGEVEVLRLRLSMLENSHQAERTSLVGKLQKGKIERRNLRQAVADSTAQLETARSHISAMDESVSAKVQEAMSQAELAAQQAFRIRRRLRTVVYLYLSSHRRQSKLRLMFESWWYLMSVKRTASVEDLTLRDYPLRVLGPFFYTWRQELWSSRTLVELEQERNRSRARSALQLWRLSTRACKMKRLTSTRLELQKRNLHRYFHRHPWQKGTELNSWRSLRAWQANIFMAFVCWALCSRAAASLSRGVNLIIENCRMQSQFWCEVHCWSCWSMATQRLQLASSRWSVLMLRLLLQCASVVGLATRHRPSWLTQAYYACSKNLLHRQAAARETPRKWETCAVPSSNAVHDGRPYQDHRGPFLTNVPENRVFRPPSSILPCTSKESSSARLRRRETSVSRPNHYAAARCRFNNEECYVLPAQDLAVLALSAWRGFTTARGRRTALRRG